jgi:hypothetical protein
MALKGEPLGGGPGLVDKDQLVRIQARCQLTPSLAGCCDVEPVLLDCMRSYFKVMA